MFEKDLMQCRVLRQHPLGVKASIHDSDCSKTAHSTIQMQIYSYESRCKVSNFSVRLTTKFMTEHSLLNTRFPSRSNMRWIKEMHLSRQMWVPLDLLKYLHYTFDLKFWDVNKTVEIDWPCTLALAPRYSDGHRKWVWVLSADPCPVREVRVSPSVFRFLIASGCHAFCVSASLCQCPVSLCLPWPWSSASIG